MAVLHIQEYSEVAKVSSSETLEGGLEPAVATQALTFAANARSNAFNASTKFVRIVSAAACHLTFGAATTSVVGSMLLPANTVAFFAVKPGHKVAAYDGST
tara:strand:+ start:518 stop:820 length:303 start_codon:yes stop_codon:yes gene_type:complete